MISLKSQSSRPQRSYLCFSALTFVQIPTGSHHPSRPLDTVLRRSKRPSQAHRGGEPHTGNLPRGGEWTKRKPLSDAFRFAIISTCVEAHLLKLHQLLLRLRRIYLRFSPRTYQVFTAYWYVSGCTAYVSGRTAYVSGCTAYVSGRTTPSCVMCSRHSYAYSSWVDIDLVSSFAYRST